MSNPNGNQRGTQGRPPVTQSTALAVQPPADLASPGDFGEEHKRIVRDFFCAGASPAEFEVLWAGARARRLDPVRRQVHFVSRPDMDGRKVWSSQVSIDGFRSIAEASGKYDGQDEPEFETDERDGVVLARVKVYRKDIGRPFVGVARWIEFAQLKTNGDPTRMWAKMPWHMLAKCAEALALRKAFPEELAGLYEPAETGNDLPPGDSWNDRKPTAEPVVVTQRKPAEPIAVDIGREGSDDK